MDVMKIVGDCMNREMARVESQLSNQFLRNQTREASSGETECGILGRVSYGGIAEFRGHERILFVDDEESLTVVCKHILEHYGYAVETRTSGQEALRLFCTDPLRFDIIVSDQTMPGMTGVELAAQIHEIRPEIPFILITGFSGSITLGRIQNQSICECIAKPVMGKDLEKIIRNLLDYKYHKDDSVVKEFNLRQG